MMTVERNAAPNTLAAYGRDLADAQAFLKKRGGLMGGLMLLAFLFLFKNAAIELRIAWGLFYALAFIPLTYWIDRTAHRTYLRRVARQDEKKA